MVRPDHFTTAERDQVASNVYELLLLLADALARPLPGEGSAAQAQGALRMLGRAARVHPPTLAYHAYRARYLDQLGQAEGAARERRLANELEASAVSSTDSFLTGNARYQHQAWDSAQMHFEQ